MKPDWKDAPRWARYLAMDAGGLWYWYAMEPAKGNDSWYRVEASRMRRAETKDVTWGSTLEPRP